MRVLKRWLFWGGATVALFGALFFAYVCVMNYFALQGAYQTLEGYQSKIRNYANDDFPTQKTIDNIQKLHNQWVKDLKELVRKNYDREHQRTKFEMFFSEFGLTDDETTIDLNQYRSIYETRRDKVLSRAAEEGDIKLASKLACGL